jgi:hypothetical protein
MDHPGVKTLLDRIAHQNAFKKSEPQDENVRKDIFLKPDNMRATATTTDPSQFSRLADFKESLKQRMKAKRLQIRKEEEEEEQIDEEYHKTGDVKEQEKKSKETEEAADDINAVLGGEDDEEEEEIDEEDDEEDEEPRKHKKKNNIDASDDNDSDTEFKLNLNSDDEAKSDDEDSHSSSENKKKNVYEFDSDGDESKNDNAGNTKKRSKTLKKNKLPSEIPLTNSIPSNQLTKVNLKKIPLFSFSKKIDLN